MAMVVVMSEWRDEVLNGTFNLLIAEIVHRSKFCGATEPKDRIFSLLSLASDVDVETFKPD
jgi:hypothetical protein